MAILTGTSTSWPRALQLSPKKGICPMKEVMLVNRLKIPHYRVAVYNRLSEYLENYEFHLTVVAEGIEQRGEQPIRFRFIGLSLRIAKLAKLIVSMKPDIIILWVNHELQFYPILLLAKVMKVRLIHWGHRRNLQRNHDLLNNIVYSFEHWLDDAIILYGEHLRKYVSKRFQPKTFVANNTLNMTIYKSVRAPRKDVKERYQIYTNRNIICLGRLQRRKRINDLILALRQLDDDDVGLILAGPDSEGVLANIKDRKIFKVGAIYGEDSLDLLSAADVCCIPGAIGLSIVDAFYCGLPVVTEKVNHGPEIMYLKDGVNGFLVPPGDIDQLAAKLRLLLSDDIMRERFSRAAKNEVMTNGHIDRMAEGFRDALQYVCR